MVWIPTTITKIIHVTRKATICKENNRQSLKKNNNNKNNNKVTKLLKVHR